MSNRLTSAQIRGARAMLDWSMFDLAKATQVSVSTVKRIENVAAAVSPSTMSQIQSALEAVGVRFLADEGSGPGVRLKLSQAPVFSRFL